MRNDRSSKSIETTWNKVTDLILIRLRSKTKLLCGPVQIYIQKGPSNKLIVTLRSGILVKLRYPLSDQYTAIASFTAPAHQILHRRGTILFILLPAKFMRLLNE